MKALPIVILAALTAILAVPAASGQDYSLSETPAWHLQPGDRTYLTTAYDEQGLAYNPQTGHLLLVHGRDGAESVHIIDAADGAAVGELSVADVSGGTRMLRKIAVDSEGVIYAGNLTTNSRQNPYRIYRWADEDADPEVVYEGDPSNGVTGALTRYGDNLSLRGSGQDTELLVLPDHFDQSLQVVRVAARLTFDESGSTLAGEFSEYETATSFGLGVDFGPGETFWGTRAGQPLREFAFAGNVLRTFGGSVFASSVSPIRIDVERDLLAGVAAGTSDLYLYRLSELSEGSFNAPLAVRNFHTGNASVEGTGEIAFSPDRVFALSTNNGIAAFDLVEPTEPEPVEPGDLYWTNSSTVRTADLVDGNPRNVMEGLSRPIGVSVDSAAGHVYWAEDQGNRIVRSRVDGTEVTVLLTDRSLPQFLVVHPDEGRMYWTQWTQGLFAADLDGGNVAHLIDQDTNQTSGLTLDTETGELYMASAANGEIFRVDGSGDGLTSVTTLSGGVYGLAFDSAAKVLYATNFNTGTLQRHDVDSGTTETVYDGLQQPLGITLSTDGGTLYWVERVEGRVKSAPADGSATPEILASGETSPFGIALRSAPAGETFEQWVIAQGVPEGLRGPEDDPDGDGVPNLVEFGLGLSPLVSSRDQLPRPAFEVVDGEPHLSLAAARNPLAVGVSWVVEVSGDLLEWRSGGADITVLEDSPDLLHVRDNTPAGEAGRRFIRLRITLNP